MSPSSRICSSCSSRLMRLMIVWKFVSMPPIQRRLTNGMPQRRASSSIVSWACFLVPTNMIVPPFATNSRTQVIASSRRRTVCWRSMMWMPLRSVKMNGRIFGSQRRV